MATKASPVETYSVRQVAESLGIGRDKILRWIAAGLLPAMNLGAGSTRPRWRISREALDAFLKSRQTAPQQQSRRHPKAAVRDYFSE
jgi:excisionase family DNA binding protein